MQLAETNSIPKPFTVIGIYLENLQIFSDHVEAVSKKDALIKSASTREDANFIAVVPGHIFETQGAITYVGNVSLDGETILNKPELLCSIDDNVTTPLSPEVSDRPALTLDESPILKSFLADAIKSVERAAEVANVSTVNFAIDSSFSDCGEIETSEVADLLDEFGLLFGEHHSVNYLHAVDTICDVINTHFAQKVEA